MVYLGILLATDLLCTKIPDKILNEVSSEKRIETNLNTAYKILFPRAVVSYTGKLQNKLFYMSLMSSFKDKLYFIHDLVFKPTRYEWSLIALPHYLYFLYYLLRPIRLGVKYLNKLVSSIGR